MESSGEGVKVITTPVKIKMLSQEEDFKLERRLLFQNISQDDSELELILSLKKEKEEEIKLQELEESQKSQIKLTPPAGENMFKKEESPYKVKIIEKSEINTS
jgi:hypothetical protein